MNLSKLNLIHEKLEIKLPCNASSLHVAEIQIIKKYNFLISQIDTISISIF